MKRRNFRIENWKFSISDMAFPDWEHKYTVDVYGDVGITTIGQCRTIEEGKEFAKMWLDNAKLLKLL